MRHAFLVALFCFIAAPIAYAQDAAPKADRVQLVEDDANGAFLFVIDGKEVARLDSSGLHVDGNVTSDNSIVLPVVHEPANVSAPPGKGGP